MLRLSAEDNFDISGPIAIEGTFMVFRIDRPAQESLLDIASQATERAAAYVRKQQGDSGNSQVAFEA